MNKTGSYIRNNKHILSIYFTADFPNKGDTKNIILTLQNTSVDLIEIGVPFSDPLADGPIIQQSSEQAIANGFTIQNMFTDLKQIKTNIVVPLILMGYFNNMLAFGIEEYLQNCKDIGIDTVILPDLPIEIYIENYLTIFKKYDVSLVFLVTPQTSDNRIRLIDKYSNSFIYVVSDNSITGKVSSFSVQQIQYFQKLKNMKLQNPLLIGFGISNNETFTQTTQFAKGAIIGSAFIRVLMKHGINPNEIRNFIQSIKKSRL
jgi:tryptophan synthase alpha chain